MNRNPFFYQRRTGTVYMKKLLLSVVFIAALFAHTAVGSAEAKGSVFLRDDFGSLANWKPFFLPGCKLHSVYTIEKENDNSSLKAESHASASAVICKESFNVYEFPRVRWRWKVMNIYAGGDQRTKQGNDFPIRIYIMFLYDPDKAGAFERLEYGAAKKLYGEYPPQSSLTYVWANKEDPERIVTSPFTNRAKIILLEKGTAKIGTWVDEEVDILDDYRKAFGKDPPEKAAIAVMNDSDNTGENSISYLDYLEVFKQ